MTVTVATLKGAETKIGNESLEELRMTIRGDVFTPEDPGYAMVRSAYNAMHPGKPSLVVRPSGTADVVTKGGTFAPATARIGWAGEATVSSHG